MQIEMHNRFNPLFLPFAAFNKIALNFYRQPFRQQVLKTLNISLPILCSFMLPFPTLIAGILSVCCCKIISDGNLNGFAKQNSKGIDLDACQRMIKSAKATIELNKICHQWLYVSCAAFTIFTKYRLGLAISLLPPRWDLFQAAKQQEQIIADLLPAENAFLNAQELSRIKELYPSIDGEKLKAKCLEEKERREEKKIYLQEQQQCMAKAWEKMLAEGSYTIAQGLEGDIEIFTPLCCLAVAEELEKPVTLQEERCPPTLQIHLHKLKQTQQLYQQLLPKKKAMLLNLLMNPNSEHDASLKEVSLKINDIASHLLQSQDLFKQPLLQGAERYTWKRHLIVPFFKMQILKWQNYRATLFFKC